MRRLVPVPTPRVFEVSGTVRLDATMDSTAIDAFLRPDDPVTLTSTGSLEGSLMPGRVRCSTEIQPRPSWVDSSPSVGRPGGSRRSSQPCPLTGIELDTHDGYRSVPSRLAVSLDDGPAVEFETGLELEDAVLGSTRTVRLPVEASSVSSIRLEIVASVDRLTRDWYSNAMVAMPFAVAEMRAGGLAVASTAIDTGCVDGLLSVDGRPVSVRATGSAAAARKGDALRLEGCSPAPTQPVTRSHHGGGQHVAAVHGRPDCSSQCSPGSRHRPRSCRCRLEQCSDVEAWERFLERRSVAGSRTVPQRWLGGRGRRAVVGCTPPGGRLRQRVAAPGRRG